MRLSTLIFACGLILSLVSLGPQAQAPAVRPALTQPAVSPDGQEITFVANGALWTVPSGGGAAHLLLAEDAADARPRYAPGGERLAFVSDRTGRGDIYVMDLAGGDLTRVTHADTHDQLTGWSRDAPTSP